MILSETVINIFPSTEESTWYRKSVISASGQQVLDWVNKKMRAVVENPSHLQGKARHVNGQVVFMTISPSRIKMIELGKHKRVQLL